MKTRFHRSPGPPDDFVDFVSKGRGLYNDGAAADDEDDDTSVGGFFRGRPLPRFTDPFTLEAAEGTVVDALTATFIGDISCRYCLSLTARFTSSALLSPETLRPRFLLLPVVEVLDATTIAPLLVL